MKGRGQQWKQELALNFGNWAYCFSPTRIQDLLFIVESRQDNVWGPPSPKDFTSETYEISGQIQDNVPSSEGARPHGKFPNGLHAEGSQMLGSQLGPSLLFFCLVVSELRILGWLICRRMDAGSRNNWVCAAHPSFQPTSFQPFCQLFIGADISPDGKNQLSHMQQTLLSERLWPCDEDDKVSHRPFMKLIENNLYSQLTVWFASSNHGLFWRRNHFFLWPLDRSPSQQMP